MSNDSKVTYQESFDDVLGHPYFGNICSGFGAPTECEHLLENGQRCGKSPIEHRYPSYLITETEFRERMDIVQMRKACRNCGHSIDVMCFQNQDYCSENCRKDLVEKDAARANPST